MVLLHGWACSVFSFRENLGALAEAGYRAIAIDLKGHGLSDKPQRVSEYTLDAMCTHVVEVLDALELDRVALVGHSMGGAIATTIAIGSPDRVARLALLAPVGFGAVSLLKVGQLLTPQPTRMVIPYLVPRWAIRVVLTLASGEHPSFEPRAVDEFWAPTQFPDFARAMRDLLHAFHWDPGEEDELREVRAPTLVMFGTVDRVVQGGAAERYVRCLPQARLQYVKGAGHILQEEAADEVNAALVGFLGETPPSA